MSMSLNYLLKNKDHTVKNNKLQDEKRLQKIMGNNPSSIYKVLNENDFSTRDIARQLMMPENSVRGYINKVLNSNER